MLTNLNRQQAFAGMFQQTHMRLLGQLYAVYPLMLTASATEQTETTTPMRAAIENFILDNGWGLRKVVVNLGLMSAGWAGPWVRIERSYNILRLAALWLRVWLLYHSCPKSLNWWTRTSKLDSAKALGKCRAGRQPVNVTESSEAGAFLRGSQLRISSAK